MPLSPEVNIPELEEDEEQVIETMRTYKIDFEKNEITNEFINGIEAISQFVHMRMRTPRYVYPIYSTDEGNEIEELIADKNVTEEFKIVELPRLITEALIYDERITDVTDYIIEHIDDAFRIRFKVHSVEGILEIEEVFE
ncbi:DUF2634 domain-containing protein [Oceanobacillus sp. CF4.6]|uniref:DUF2634 domain-containing protein n=1 Tax=Oceanobacillus sp. CF4.6 TaxID=3373080 RepID=UPI003EE7F227